MIGVALAAVMSGVGVSLGENKIEVAQKDKGLGGDTLAFIARHSSARDRPLCCAPLGKAFPQA